MTNMWWEIKNIDTVDSPSVAVYKEHLTQNIEHMIAGVDGEMNRLMPHIKTNKMPKVMEVLVASGIGRFKASTIAEAEIAAEAGAGSVLIAHQLVGPKVERLLDLAQNYQHVEFSTIVDCLDTVKVLNDKCGQIGISLRVYIDINNGMNRSGIEVGAGLLELIDALLESPNLIFSGFHVYDGHLRDTDFNLRNEKIESGFGAITEIFERLKAQHPSLQMICGGTPSFTSHLLKKNRITSPGTCVLWDWGYSDKLKEQKFNYAALLVTRIISKPTEGIITVDMGHKSIASENPIDKRIKFLNLENYELVSQSEEHGVIQVQDWDQYHVGDVLYGVPYHICPTINLHDEVSLIEAGVKTDTWEITARKRKLRF